MTDGAGENPLIGLIEAWLDGQLSAGEAAAFEARLAGDPALRARAAALSNRQKQVDASLRTMFRPPRAHEVLARAMAQFKALVPGAGEVQSVVEPSATPDAPMAPPQHLSEPEHDPAQSFSVEAAGDEEMASGADEDEALRLEAEVSPAGAEIGPAGGSKRSAKPARGASRRWIAAGVGAAIAASAAFAAWKLFFAAEEQLRPLVRKEQPTLTLDQAYALAVERNFKPDWVCKDDAEFQGAFATYIGQPMLFTNYSDVSMVGLSYFRCMSPNTIGMLTSAGGKRIVVFVDQIANDKPALASESGGLHIFRKELGAAVIYELTPLDHPVAMDHFRIMTTAPATGPATAPAVGGGPARG